MAPDPRPGPLAGVRVLDLTDALCAYAGRLLADLGADVVRVEPPGGTTSIRLEPYWHRDDGPAVSLFERFVNSGKRSITLDLGAVEAEPIVNRLLSSADVVIESPATGLNTAGWSGERIEAANPTLVRVRVSPYGEDGAPDRLGDSDDLLLLGAGGLLYLGGYPDIGPVAAYGFQSTYMASIYAAVAAIAALVNLEQSGEPSWPDVSAQEAVAQALEESAVDYVLTGQIRRPQGEAAKEAGTGIYRCADGYVSMVAGRLGTAHAWNALTKWMTSHDPDGGADLLDERWSSFEFRRSSEAIANFKTIFERFAADRTRQELYRDAQERGIALSPVNDLATVRDDAQLRDRHFFADVADPLLGTTLIYPGLPYRLSGTPLEGPYAAPVPGGDNTAVFRDELGLSPEEYDCLIERGVV